jgi:hypothetical protein
VSRLFDSNHRTWQEQFDTQKLADRIEERLCRDRISDDDKAFIERLDMFFLASVDASGQPTCSYKGGEPGFVRVLDAKTLLFPSEVFPNCPRYIHRYQLVERSQYVPHANVETSVPAWKQMEWARDVLPRGDPAMKKG